MILTEEEQNIVNSNNYREQRAINYPPIKEQLDALWKGGNDMEQMKNNIAAVKAQHPKEG
jgi:hypothetical protein